ncbi:acyltransferase family protein [Arthrobacter sp. NPDC080073]|uniref:acyltransferase family protein n=1 Tax=Arthrobacter sp. NPDC080073 TaxID=3155919 RepID=UPI003439856B
MQNSAPKSTFRPEIQGLRSVAVLMVVTYHIWFGRVSGGVDVFLLVSAFLMTLQFTRRFEQRRAMDLPRHWLHLFRRLLPAAVIVLLGTLAAIFAVVPKTRWAALVDQVWASLFYFQNWLLQHDVVNYYATDHSQASPLQHFWSLSVQGQVFILWPVIFALVALVCRKYALPYRAALMYVFGLIFLVSLTYSIIATAVNQTTAYFDTFARLWEFAVGTLVALILPALKLSKSVRVVMGWVGVVAMLSCGIVLQVQTAFPGFVALWPTLAAAFIIVAGQTSSRFGVDRILSSKPLVRLGDNSYALYLWHWPLLVLALVWSGKDHAGWLSGSVIIATALGLAVLTTKFVEKPVREWKWPEANRRRAVVAIALCICVAAVPLLAFNVQQTVSAKIAMDQAEKDNPGAAALVPGYVNEASPTAVLLPTAEKLAQDWVHLPSQCTGDLKPASKLLQGACGQNNQPADASRSILVLGDSHAEQWMAAVAPMADQQQWSLYHLLLGGCPFSVDSTGLGDQCRTFNQAVMQQIDAKKPTAVFLVGTAASPSSPDEKLTVGFEDTVKWLSDKGIDVVAVRDNPRFDFNMADCVVVKGRHSPDCNRGQAQQLAPEDPLAALKGKYQGLSILDMTDLICNGGECPGVVGNTFVYIDNNHLSKTYVESMAPMFQQRWMAATGWS